MPRIRRIRRKKPRAGSVWKKLLLWGVLGMFLGVPIFACAYAGVRACAAYRLRKKGLPTDTASYLSHGPVRREEEPEENKAEQE